MLPNNPICAVCDYGTSAVYRDLPSEEQRRSGVVPLDSLPAAWWNCMWYDINRSMNQARGAVGSLINELDTVLTQAGICACDTCVNQLYQAIEVLRRTIGDDTVPGAVKSSSTPGQVSIGSDGIMTANCVGNANNLNTTAHTLVGAINELKQVYDCCISDLKTCDTTLNTNKAPNNHASAATTYGVGNASNYGHVRLSDTYNTCVGAAADGIAASQKALYDMYTAITSAGYVVLGNTAGCALGTASAGSAGTAARSDHVHPDTNIIKGNLNYGYYGLMINGSDGYGIAGTCPTAFIRSTYGGYIPYCMDSTNGVSCVGTADWPFAQMHAKNFYGTFNGNASSATYVARTGTQDNARFYFPLFNGATTVNQSSLYVSSGHSLTYNPAYGDLENVGLYHTCNGVVGSCIGHLNNDYLHIYTTAPSGIAFNKETLHIEGLQVPGLAAAKFCGPIYINNGVTAYNEPGGDYVLSMDAYCDGGRVHYTNVECQAVGKLWLSAYYGEANQTLKYNSARFWWHAVCGQPEWVWGGNGDGSNMFVYSPSQFSVASATNAAYATYATYACCMCNVHNTPATCNGAARATIQSKSFYWPAGTTYETIWNDITSFLPVRYGDYYPIIWGVQRCCSGGSNPVNISAWAIQYTQDGQCVKIGNQYIICNNGWITVQCDTILTVARGIE